MIGAVILDDGLNLDAGGAIIFPLRADLIDSDRFGVARRACRICFPDGRVDCIGFVVSPRGTVHMPMWDGATVCSHDMGRDGWWYLL